MLDVRERAAVRTLAGGYDSPLLRRAVKDALGDHGADRALYLVRVADRYRRLLAARKGA